MNTKKCRFYIAAGSLVFLSVFAGTISFAQEEDKTKIQQEFRGRLTDSNGVSVYVDVIAKGKSEEQSMTEQLQEDVESQLKEFDIKILTKEDMKFAPGRPRLAVYLVTFKEPALKDVYLYSFRIVHFEDAILDRNDRYAEGICWDSGLYVGRERITSIRKTVQTHVRKYISDYLAANPKQQQLTPVR